MLMICLYKECSRRTEILLMVLMMFNKCTISAHEFPHGQLLDSVIEVASHYFIPGRSLILSFAEIVSQPVIFSEEEKQLEFDKISSKRNIELITYLLKCLHNIGHWQIIATSPKGEIKERDPLDWDPLNNDLHGSYIMITNDQDDIRQQIMHLKNYPAWNPRAKFVVILISRENNNRKLVKNILKEMWQSQIVNVIVITELTNRNVDKKVSSMLIYTWFPYLPPSGVCGKLKDVILIDSWVVDIYGGRFLQNSDLFPNKIPDNLNLCPMRASTFEFHPFIVCDNKLGIGTNTSIVDGFEVFLIRCIAEAMKMTLILRIPPGDDRGGILLENGTWTGLRADIRYDKADIIFASLLSKLEDHLLFDDTIIYFTDRFTWFVARAKPYPRWLGTARVFSHITWLVGFLAIILSAVVMRCLSSFSTIQHDEISVTYWRFVICLSSVWAVLLGDSVPNMPRSVPLRSYFLSLIIYSLAINTVFQAFFTSYVVNPGLLHQIADVEELVTSDLIYAFYYVLDKFFTTEFLHKLKPRVQCEPFTCLNYVATNDNYATFCGRALLAYITDELVKQDGKHEIYAFREDSFQLNSIMLMLKGSHLLNRVNQVMSRVIEAGLPNQWLKNVLDMRRIQAGVVALADLSDEYASLTMTHMQGAFFFLLIGLALALILFVFELLIKLKSNKIGI